MSTGISPPGGDLAALVLMAGAVRRTALSRTSGRSRLDLPVRSGVTLADCWSRTLEEVRAVTGAPLPVIIATNSTAPRSSGAEAWAGVSVALDREEPRGSGGALRDLTEGMSPDARILVASAYAYHLPGWASVVSTLRACPADVSIHTDESGSPTGTFLIRCGVLRGIPARGFVDLKEQAMPQISTDHDVRVVATAHASPFPVLTLDSYLRTVRAVASPAEALNRGTGEDWRCTFSIVEPGAQVHPGARLHDAVVLAGARVESGAVVVRSLIGPGGVVARGGSAIDELVGGPEARR